MSNITVFSRIHRHCMGVSPQSNYRRTVGLLDDVGNAMFLMRDWKLLLNFSICDHINCNCLKKMVLADGEYFIDLRKNDTVCKKYFTVIHQNISYKNGGFDEKYFL